MLLLNNLIYYSLYRWSTYDRHLVLDQYEHSGWFKTLLVDHMPPLLKSRVHQLDTPWHMAPTVCPIPKVTNNELNFDHVMDNLADQFCKLVNSSNKIPYVCWSGGIDSTGILVSLFKTADQNFLNKLVILLDPVLSINENSYFFYKFIKDKIRYQDINEFVINQQNYNQIFLVDGEGGNQCMGMAPIHKLAHLEKFDLLDQPWPQTNLSSLIWVKDNDTTKIDFIFDLVKQSLNHCPISIETTYDLLWWINFNFKFDDVLLRKLPYYIEHLTADQAKNFFYNSLYRFYATDEMQIWSMISKDLRREKSRIDVKYFLKKYIFDFDNNDLYFSNKGEQLSTAKSFVFMKPDLFAIDSEFRTYSYKSQKDRTQLGKALKRPITGGQDFSN